MAIKVVKYRDASIGYVLQGDLSFLLDAMSMPPATAALEEVKCWHINRALKASEGNKTQAARTLAVHRMTLYRHEAVS